MERSYPSHYFFLAFLLFHTFPILANCDINIDISSLLSLKSQITSDPHTILIKNWTTQTPVCIWIGVTCDSRYNRVTQLDISGMGLVGTIPPEIGNLSFLVSLDMDGNSFHGPIPPSVFNISSLEILSLGKNSLSSSLPNDMCKNGFSKLKTLIISYNEMNGDIPLSLGQCSDSEYIDFGSNMVGGEIPREIGNITLLHHLDLGSNDLNGMYLINYLSVL